MKRFDIKYFIFISLIVLFGFLTPTELIAKSDYIKPTILHNPIEKMYESQPFIIESIVTDNDELNDVIIYYRITGKSEFKYESMTLDFNNYQFEVPFEDIDSRGLEYYIMAIDNSDNRTYAPENDPEDYPYQVDYISFSNTSAPDALLLNPEDGSVNSESNQIIIISLYDEEDDIDLSSIVMEIDGMDVTEELDITQDLITYIPPNGFTIGSHSVLFFVRDKMGNEAPSAHWTFFIKEVKVDVKKPWLADTRIKGVIDYESEFNTFSGKDQPENRPFDTQKPRVKLTFKRKNVKATIGLALNKHFDPAANDVVKYRQPLDRFRFTIETPYLLFKGGDQNPTFSELTLKGARIRGTVTDFHYKGFNTQFVYGRTKEMIPGFTGSVEDSSAYNKGTFSRKLIGLSSSFNYRDIIEIGVNYFQAEDDITSLEDESFGNFTDLPDALQEKYTAQSNQVAGINSKLKFGGHTELVSYWAASIITEDIINSVSKNLAISTYNDDEGIASNITKGTYLVEFTNRNQFFDVKGSMKRIPRSFSSLGNPSIQTDIQGLQLDGRTKFSNNQIMLNLGYENTRNNLDLLDVQTISNITYSTNVNIAKPGLPGLNLGYRFMTHEGEATAMDTAGDVTLSNDMSSTITIAPSYSVKIKNIEFGLSGNLMFMNFRDISNPDASFASNSYMLAVAQTFPNRLSMNFGFGLSQNIPSVDSETAFTMLNGKFAYPLKNKKIKIYLGSTLVLGFKSRNHKYDSGENFIDLPDNTSEFNGVWDEGEYFQDKNEIDNRKVSFNVGGQYKISKSQFIGLDIGYVTVSDFAVDVVGSKDYSEIRGKLKYKYTF